MLWRVFEAAKPSHARIVTYDAACCSILIIFGCMDGQYDIGLNSRATCRLRYNAQSDGSFLRTTPTAVHADECAMTTSILFRRHA
jgi:hypothetical protein